MIAKLAYLTTPAPNRFVLNVQSVDTLGNDVVLHIEISKAHLSNILIDGTALALRDSSVHRVQSLQTENAENERAGT